MKNERGKRKSNPQTEDELLIKALKSMSFDGKKRNRDPESISPNSGIKNAKSEQLEQLNYSNKRPKSNTR